MSELAAYLKTEDVAVRLRTSPGTVRYWRWAGTGPTGWVTVGRRKLLPVERLREYEDRIRAEALSEDRIRAEALTRPHPITGNGDAA